MVKLPKAAAAALLLLILLLDGCGVQREKRFDYSELNRRIAAASPEFAFTETGMLYSGGTYYAWYSLHAPDDLLLTMREDETGRLDRIALSCLAVAPEETQADFVSLALLLAKIFIPDLAEDAFLSETGLGMADPPPLGRFRQGFYSAALLTTNAGKTVLLEYGIQ